MRTRKEITLIQPPRPETRHASAEQDWTLARPFSLFYLATAVRSQTDWNARMLDLEARRYRNSALDGLLADCESGVFGVTACTYTRFEAAHIVHRVKELHPDSVVVAGGPHFGNCAQDTLDHIPEVDVVVRGEGELPLVELLTALDRGSGLQGVRGISHRTGGKVVHNADQCSFVDVDAAPAYEDFDWDDYSENLFGYPQRVRATSVLTSRGCPYRCIYCAKSSSGYRLKKPAAVVDELERLKSRHGVEGINFLDLTLTASPEHIRSLCEEMIRRRVNVKWWCESRANIDLDLLPLMRKAGCVSLAVGVESGSPRMLKQLRKDIAPGQALAFCKRCHELGIGVTAYFMYSLPGETESDVSETLRLMSRMGEYADCHIQPCMVFPGTEVERIARERAILPADFSWAAPYSSELNVELGQLANVPLYVEHDGLERLKAVRQEIDARRQDRARIDWLSTTDFRESVRLVCRYIFIKRGRIGNLITWRNIKRWYRQRSSAERRDRSLVPPPGRMLLRRMKRIERKSRCPGLFSIPTHLTAREKVLLFELAARLPASGVVVEVGSYLGASTCFLAAGARAGRVYAVDTWTNIEMSEGARDTYDGFLKNTEPFRQAIIPLRGLSCDIARDFQTEIDLLFVDGAHSYDAVAADLRAWLPKLADGAVVVLHDYGWAEGVQRAVAELVRPIELSSGIVVESTYWTRVRSAKRAAQ